MKTVRSARLSVVKLDDFLNDEYCCIAADNPILNAIVIGCEECGGSGEVAEIDGYGETTEVDMVICPLCKGKSFVVSEDAWEAARRTFCTARHCSDQNDEQWSGLCPESCKARIDARLHAITSALLGGEVYEATEMLERVVGVTVQLSADEVREDDDPPGTIVLGGERSYEVSPPSTCAFLRRAVTADCHSKEE